MRVAPAWTLGILAGGESRRLGRDKATVPFAGTTLLQHVAGRLAPEGVPVIVATRPDGPGRDLGYPWVPDELPGEGPLSGATALLYACETPFLLLVPCDAPLLPPLIGDRLLDRAPGVDGVLAVAEGRTWPLPALLTVDLAPLFRSLLEGGARRADAWLEHAPAALIPFEDLCPGVSPERAFLNVNTPEDLVRAEAIFTEEGGRVDPESVP